MLLRERDGSCPRLSKHGLPRLIQIAGCSHPVDARKFGAASQHRRPGKYSGGRIISM
jgi:hypothetical protein